MRMGWIVEPKATLVWLLATFTVADTVSGWTSNAPSMVDTS